MILRNIILVIISVTPVVAHSGDARKGQEISSACISCHGAYGLSSTDQYPNLAGQKESYLIKQLQAFQSGQRINSAMQAQVGPLTSQNIQDLAAFYASNSTLPNYSDISKVLNIPLVKVLSTWYQVEMLLEPNGQFSLKTTNPLP